MGRATPSTPSPAAPSPGPAPWLHALVGRSPPVSGAGWRDSQPCVWESGLGAGEGRSVGAAVLGFPAPRVLGWKCAEFQLPPEESLGGRICRVIPQPSLECRLPELQARSLVGLGLQPSGVEGPTINRAAPALAPERPPDFSLKSQFPKARLPHDFLSALMGSQGGVASTNLWGCLLGHRGAGGIPCWN